MLYNVWPSHFHLFVQHVQTISTYSFWSSNRLVPVLRVLSSSLFFLSLNVTPQHVQYTVCWKKKTNIHRTVCFFQHAVYTLYIVHSVHMYWVWCTCLSDSGKKKKRQDSGSMSSDNHRDMAGDMAPVKKLPWNKRQKQQEKLRHHGTCGLTVTDVLLQCWLCTAESSH